MKNYGFFSVHICWDQCCSTYAFSFFHNRAIKYIMSQSFFLATTFLETNSHKVEVLASIHKSKFFFPFAPFPLLTLVIFCRH